MRKQITHSMFFLNVTQLNNWGQLFGVRVKTHRMTTSYYLYLSFVKSIQEIPQHIIQRENNRQACFQLKKIF